MSEREGSRPEGTGRAVEYTIGRLARRARVAPSVLRYYEKEGLLTPARRTASGYRVYGADAERTLRFINRAKRLGFSLDDIRRFLGASRAGGRTKSGGDLAQIAAERFVEIERRLTELLVLRHELEVFLRDVSAQVPAGDGPMRLYQRLVDHVCGHDSTPVEQAGSLKDLMQRMGCNLGEAEGDIPAVLRGRHLHVWREGQGYRVLIPGDDPELGHALRQLAASEAGCSAHHEPEVEQTPEGYVFSAEGDNAFLFAQFFLALEQEAPPL